MSIFFLIRQHGTGSSAGKTENDAGITLDDLKLLFHGDGKEILSKVKHSMSDSWSDSMDQFCP